MYAHLNDPIPSARASAPGVPESLDRIIAKAMAKQPADRFDTGEELARALSGAGDELRATELRPPVSVPGSHATTELVEPATVVPNHEIEATAVATKAVAEEATVQLADTRTEPDGRAPTVALRRRRRTSRIVVLPVAVLIIAGVLVAVLSSGSGNKHPATGAVSQSAASTPGPASTGGLRVVTRISLPGTPTAITADPTTNQIWVAGPDYAISEPGARKTSFNGTPSAIAAGAGQLWISDPTAGLLYRYTTGGGKVVSAGSRSSNTTLLVVDPRDGSAYVADASGRIAHIGSDMRFVQLGAVTPAPSALAFGEGNHLWAVNGRQLMRIDPRAPAPIATFKDGSNPVGLTLNRGVWAAQGDGAVTRFDPRGTYKLPNGTSGHGLHVNANVAVAAPAPLSTIVAIESGAELWTASPQTRTVYRIAYNTGRVTGTMTLRSAPVGLAATPAGVWVITRDAELIQIR
jgi:hypothetical protein